MLSACWEKKWRLSGRTLEINFFVYYESHNNLDIWSKWWWTKWRQTFFYVFLYFFQWKTHFFPFNPSFFSCNPNSDKTRIQNQFQISAFCGITNPLRMYEWFEIKTHKSTQFGMVVFYMTSSQITQTFNFSLIH